LVESFHFEYDVRQFEKYSSFVRVSATSAKAIIIFVP